MENKKKRKLSPKIVIRIEPCTCRIANQEDKRENKNIYPEIIHSVDELSNCQNLHNTR